MNDVSEWVRVRQDMSSGKSGYVSVSHRGVSSALLGMMCQDDR